MSPTLGFRSSLPASWAQQQRRDAAVAREQKLHYQITQQVYGVVWGQMPKRAEYRKSMDRLALSADPHCNHSHVVVLRRAIGEIVDSGTEQFRQLLQRSLTVR